MGRKIGPFLGRRGFLKGAGLAAGALAAPLTAKTAEAQNVTPSRAPSIPALPISSKARIAK